MRVAFQHFLDGRRFLPVVGVACLERPEYLVNGVLNKRRLHHPLLLVSRLGEEKKIIYVDVN